MIQFLIITYLVTVAFSAFVQGMVLTKELDIRDQLNNILLISIVPVINVVVAMVDLGLMFNKKAK